MVQQRSLVTLLNAAATIKAARDQSVRTGSAIMKLGASIERRNYADLSQYHTQADMFARSSWVYIAVDRKATAGALVALNVMKLVNEKRQGIVNHPLELLMKRPNSYQTQFEFMYQTLAILELTGNSYWYIEAETIASPPTELIIMRPDRIRIVPGETTDQPIKAYLYEVDGIQVPLDPAQVAHFTIYNPRSDYYGLSRLEAGHLAINTDLNQQQYNASFFGEDRAVPAGLLKLKKESISDTEYEQAEDDWKRAYGSGQRKTAILRADVDFQMMGLSHEDMEFLQGRQFNKEEIFQIFGVPPGLMDKNATEANALAALQLFYDNTVWPMMIQLAQKVGLKLTPYYPGGALLEVVPDDIRKKDQAQERLAIQAAMNFHTINEIRADFYDKPPVDWGDIPAAGAGAVAITGQPVASQTAQIKPGEAREEPGDKQTAQQEIAAENADNTSEGASVPKGKSHAPLRVFLDRDITREIGQFSRAVKGGKHPDNFVFDKVPPGLELALKSLADADMLALLTSEKAIYNASARVDLAGKPDPMAREKTKAAKELQAATQAYFAGLSGRLAANLDHTSTAPKQGFWDSEVDRLIAVLKPIMAELIDMAAVATSKFLMLQYGIPTDEIEASNAAAAGLADWVRTWPDKIIETTRDGINAIFARYSGTPGSTPDQLSSAIAESAVLGQARAAGIAETEVTRGVATGAFFTADTMATMTGATMVCAWNLYQTLIPAHPFCRCWVTILLVVKDGKVVGVDGEWHTVHDADVCEICDNRMGHTISEILNLGLYDAGGWGIEQ